MLYYRLHLQEIRDLLKDIVKYTSKLADQGVRESRYLSTTPIFHWLRVIPRVLIPDDFILGPFQSQVHLHGQRIPTGRETQKPKAAFRGTVCM